jgi:glycogen debranching enzyme
MPLEIPVGPPQLAVHQGHSLLLTDRDGQIPWPSDKGLYFFDTRLISSWSIFANGEPWELLNSGNSAQYASRVFLTNREIATEGGTIPMRTLGLVLSRSISGGVHEDLDIVNYGMQPVRFNLEIAIRSDFADLFEVKSGHIVRRGRIVTQWSDDESRLRAIYRNQDFCREVTVLARRHGSPPVYANGRISFELELQPGAAWHSCLLYELGNGKVRLEVPEPCIAESHRSRAGRLLAKWRNAVLKMHSASNSFDRCFDHAVHDMAALRLPVEDTDHLQFVPAGGVPWFVAPFGRDSLIASLQNAPVYPGFACGALALPGSHQATERDDYRDAEPGKIMHEMRFGEFAHFKLIPHTPYCGTADATMLYLIVLHVAWRWTGDAALLERHLETAMCCLDWIDRYGDRDGDGFQEYASRLPEGYENQGWKDSGDAVLNSDGTPVKGPKALCELQGYVYDAWLRMAEIFDFLGNADRAQALRAKADSLLRRFNDAFWDEPSGFYAYALDGDRKQVLTVASNPDHCLWSGIVPADRAARVVNRLMQPDMWSGWGIRTLSAGHPAYNPHGYQNGSVWTQDNGIIALGFRRYGFASEAARIAHDVIRAASYFMLHQLPELYSGVDRDPTNFSVQYLGANVPQAWAAGSVFAFLQVILGFQPDAPHGRLYLDPALPPWLPELTVTNLQLGQASFDLRFWRDGKETRWKVLDGDDDAVASRSCATGNGL